MAKRASKKSSQTLKKLPTRTAGAATTVVQDVIVAPSGSYGSELGRKEAIEDKERNAAITSKMLLDSMIYAAIFLIIMATLYKWLKEDKDVALAIISTIVGAFAAHYLPRKS
jgi:hypothetical protein